MAAPKIVNGTGRPRDASRLPRGVPAEHGKQKKAGHDRWHDQRCHDQRREQGLAAKLPARQQPPEADRWHQAGDGCQQGDHEREPYR